MIVLIAIARLLVIELAVSVTTAWTPPTSFDRRLWISPVRVSVKKRSGIALEVRVERAAQVLHDVLADDVVEVALADADQAGDDRAGDHQPDVEVQLRESPPVIASSMSSLSRNGLIRPRRLVSQDREQDDRDLRAVGPEEDEDPAERLAAALLRAPARNRASGRRPSPPPPPPVPRPPRPHAARGLAHAAARESHQALATATIVERRDGCALGDQVAGQAEREGRPGAAPRPGEMPDGREPDVPETGRAQGVRQSDVRIVAGTDQRVRIRRGRLDQRLESTANARRQAEVARRRTGGGDSRSSRRAGRPGRARPQVREGRTRRGEVLEREARQDEVEGAVARTHRSAHTGRRPRTRRGRGAVHQARGCPPRPAARSAGGRARSCEIRAAARVKDRDRPRPCHRTRTPRR